MPIWVIPAFFVVEDSLKKSMTGIFHQSPPPINEKTGMTDKTSNLPQS